MFQRRWNPGIGREIQIDTISAHYNQDGKFGNQGRNRERRSVSDLRGFAGESFQFGFRSAISIFTKTNPSQTEGIISVIIKTESFRIVSLRVSFISRLKIVGFWKARILILWDNVIRVIRRILDCGFVCRFSIDNVDYGRCGINGIDLSQGKKYLGDYYIMGFGSHHFNTTFESFSTYVSFSLICCLVSWLVVMDDAEYGLNDRARSYKGVVINGNGGQQDRGREKREYQGKGKGKMFEETDSKWVRAADRESKASNHKNHRNGHRGDEGNSRPRNSRREHTRTHHQDDRSRNSAGTRGERVSRTEFQPEGLEEGEIKEKEMERSTQMEEKVPERTQPSQAFLDALMETQGELSKVLSNPSSGEQELGVENMDLGIVDGNNVETDGSMGLAGNYIEDASFGNHEGFGEDEVQMLAEEEMEEEVKAQVVMPEALEEKKKLEDMDGKDGVAGEVEKRQGIRKKVVKPSVGAAASNKLKMAQLVSAKRVVAKPGIRHGDHSKQGEDKGTSGPKHDSAKQVKDP
ncbi:hypothetical protein IGI04_004156 [Brassica rapa subsp. trilocularis]|uniref:Uncharacterized protein n=1 Tax=Brassica rapa subsp. trilocularis TaxID=1813537 RepID=A0ABQ7P0J4_BRACM|nr:hypothetical protein IGI04_004156 [Brassica rapa subsp. trilocularis]